MWWHVRWSYISFLGLKWLFYNMFKNFKNKDLSCDVCQLAKHVKTTFPISEIKSNKSFSLVHSDMWWPSRMPLSNDSQYFVTFIDDYSRNTFVYLMHIRENLFHVIQNFIAFVGNQYETTIQTFRSNNAKEYTSHRVEVYFARKGIVHKISCSYTPP